MGFFNKVWSGLDFWDKQENQQQRQDFARQEEEEKKRRQQIQNAKQYTQQQPSNQTYFDEPQSSSATTTPVSQNVTSITGALGNPFLNITNQTDAQKAEGKQIADKTKKLNELTDKYRQEYIDKEKQNTSWFNRQFVDRNWDKRAETLARTRASREFQEQEGFNRDPAITQYSEETRRKLDKLSDNSGSKVLAPVLSTGRVGAGIAQGTTGFYDLITPGEGTNRFTKSITEKAEEVDALAKDLDIDGLYKTGNVAGEALSYLSPAILTKGGKVATFGDDVTKLIAGKGGKYRKFAADFAQEILDPKNIENEIIGNTRYFGQDTARGKSVSGASIAENAAMSTAGAFMPVILRKGISKVRGVDEGIAGGTSALTKADDIIKQPDTNPKVEIAPGIKVDAPSVDVPKINSQVDIPTQAQPPIASQVDIPTSRSVDIPPIAQQTSTFEITRPEPLMKAPIQQTLLPDVPEQVTPSTQPLRQASDIVQQNALPQPEIRPSAIQTPEQALQEKALVKAEKVPQTMKAEAVISDNPPITPVDKSGKPLADIISKEAVEPELSIESLKQEAKEIKTRTIKTADGKNEYVAQLGNSTKDRVGRQTGFKATETSPNFKTEGEMNAWIKKNIDTQSQPAKTDSIQAAPKKAVPVEKTVVETDTSFAKNRVSQALDPENPLQYRNLNADERRLYKEQMPKKAVSTSQTELPKTVSDDVGTTGEIGLSKGKASKGQEYNVKSREAFEQAGKTEADKTNYKDFIKKIYDEDAITDTDAATAKALRDRFEAGSEEHKLLSDIMNKNTTEAAQTLALVERTVRRIATARQLTDRFSSKLYRQFSDADVKNTLTKADFDTIRAKNEAFEKTRDNLTAAHNKFLENPSTENKEAALKAFREAAEADKAAKFAEYDLVATKGKKSTDKNIKKFIKEKESEAGVYTMDWVDQSLLSSLATMRNNTLNNSFALIEEALLGKRGAKRATKKTGEIIGGGLNEGTVKGIKIGFDKWKSDNALRKAAHGNAFTKFFKNKVTAGNTFGETSLMGTVYSGVNDHYKQVLKKAGFTGDEFKRRLEVNTVLDPDGIFPKYEKIALADLGMATMSRLDQKKLESRIQNTIAEKMGNRPGSATLAKIITRMSVGYPTIIARTAERGARRASFGVPTSIQASIALRKGTAEGRAEAAQLIKQAYKERGSGAALTALGATLYASGNLVGSYPKDEAERERWEREGISENSIKIGSDWHSVPSAAGVFALPLLLPANIASAIKNEEGVGGVAKGVVGTVVDSMPIESMVNVPNLVLDWLGDKDTGKGLTQLGASAVRTLIPAGSFFNQLAQAFDSTKSDPDKERLLDEFFAKVQRGIPGLSNMLPDKEIDGQVIKNPSFISKMAGVISTEQTEGVEKTKQISRQIDENVKKLNDYGAMNDTMRNILDDDTKVLFDKAKNGKKLKEDDIKKITDGITKNITKTDDSHFLEKEDYDNNIIALKLKKDSLAADPTTTKATLDDYDTQIKRGELYKKNKTPYSIIKDYREIDLSDWRKLGDPDDDEYSPETKALYEQLWAIDKEMAGSGVSRNSKSKDKQKYYAKEKKTGRGGSGGRGSSSGSGAAKLRSSGFRQLSTKDTLKDNKYVAVDKPKEYIPDLGLNNKAKTDLKKSIKIEKGVKYV